MRTANLLAYVAALFLFVCPARAAAPAITLKITPQVSQAPTTIRFTVTIEPNAANRKACLTYDGAEAGMSCWQVDGDTHPRTQWFQRRIGAAGEYFATVTLVAVVGDKVKHTTDARTFIVTEPGIPFVR
jgi:hypothetical protein